MFVQVRRTPTSTKRMGAAEQGLHRHSVAERHCSKILSPHTSSLLTAVTCSPVTAALCDCRYYDCALKNLITSWRSSFGHPTCFFGVVMLAAYIRDSTFPNDYIASLRDCQLAALNLPKVAVVTATDLGDPGTAAGPGGASTLHSVHPRHKAPLGLRLAAAALDHHYSVPGSARLYLSPRYRSARLLDGTRPSELSAVEIHFELLPAEVLPLRLLTAGQPTTADPHGLSTACPVHMGVPVSACAGFEVQTDDGAWHTASVRSIGIRGNSIILAIASANRSTASLTATRFGQAPWPVNSVITAGDVPLFPWQAHPIS